MHLSLDDEDASLPPPSTAPTSTVTSRAPSPSPSPSEGGVQRPALNISITAFSFREGIHHLSFASNGGMPNTSQDVADYTPERDATAIALAMVFATGEGLGVGADVGTAGMSQTSAASGSRVETTMRMPAVAKVARGDAHRVHFVFGVTEPVGDYGEEIANKAEIFGTMIRVFEYYISHHLTEAFESMFGCCSRIRHVRRGFASAARVRLRDLVDESQNELRAFKRVLSACSSVFLLAKSLVRLCAGNTGVLVDNVASSRVRLCAGKTAVSVLGDATDIVQVGFARATAASVLWLRSTPRPSRLRAGNRSECLATGRPPSIRLRAGNRSKCLVAKTAQTSSKLRLRAGNTSASGLVDDVDIRLCTGKPVASGLVNDRRLFPSSTSCVTRASVAKLACQVVNGQRVVSKFRFRAADIVRASRCLSFGFARVMPQRVGSSSKTVQTFSERQLRAGNTATSASETSSSETAASALETSLTGAFRHSNCKCSGCPRDEFKWRLHAGDELERQLRASETAVPPNSTELVPFTFQGNLLIFIIVACIHTWEFCALLFRSQASSLILGLNVSEWLRI
ncbi:hypothetical protein B0H11DRAFT_2369563 [Mycena galericulata]|nr:hypothetical protein B0H11DRAFT_2369563 [Mycena galericulata]